VGQYLPCEDGPATIAWADGAASRAVASGACLLVEGLESGPAQVTERLNPLLEQPAVWLVAEAGESAARHVLDTFRFAATATPPAHGLATGPEPGSELSPALANRLTAFHLPSLSEASEAAFQEEVTQLAKGLLGPSDAAALAVSLASLLRSHGGGGLALRTLVRLLDVVSQELSRFAAQPVSPAQALWGAFVNVCGDDGPVAGAVREMLSASSGGELSVEDGCGDGGDTEVGALVLTPQRQRYATRLEACLLAGQAVLLEGPAGVGKTALAAALADKHGKQLWRVNVSESTTPADFFGAFLPASGQRGCAFREGPLLRAMREGHWFLADELDLAQPG
jgi:hypothetical protein